MTDEITRTLVDRARAAAAQAHAPYSGFGVGAALLLADGSIITVGDAGVTKHLQSSFAKE